MPAVGPLSHGRKLYLYGSVLISLRDYATAIIHIRRTVLPNDPENADPGLVLA